MASSTTVSNNQLKLWEYFESDIKNRDTPQILSVPNPLSIHQKQMAWGQQNELKARKAYVEYMDIPTIVLVVTELSLKSNHCADQFHICTIQTNVTMAIKEVVRVT